MTTSERKLQANRKNSAKGGEVTRAKFDAIYLQDPSFCKHCDKMLPREKKYNKFCNSSCAGTFNSTGRVRQKKPRGDCAECGEPLLKVASKFCSIKCASINRTFRTDEEIRLLRNQTSAKYRAALRNQTPVWADIEAIKLFYLNCPNGHEVDHIIPISKGGLHVLENLQYLTITENRSKGNTMVS